MMIAMEMYQTVLSAYLTTDINIQPDINWNKSFQTDIFAV